MTIFSVLLISLFFVFIVFKHLKRTKTKLPPGPRKLPLIGNLHQLTSSSPHKSLTDLAKKHGPLMHLKLGELSAVVISSPEVAEEAIRSHELSFAQRPMLISLYGGAGVVFSEHGKYWRQLRHLCMSELLSHKRVRSFGLVREEEVWNLIESIPSSSGHPINLTDRILEASSRVTSRVAFGNELKYASDFVSLAKEGTELGAGLDLTELFPSLKFLHFLSSTKAAMVKLFEGMDKILQNIINEHQARRVKHGNSTGNNDLVDVLLNLKESNDLEFSFTTTDIKAIILDIVSAGTDTTATTIEWAMAELVKNPKIMEKAQAEVRHVLKGKRKINEEDIQELDYLKLVVKETLRLHPATPLIPRESIERFRLDEYEIPAKAKVIINMWAIGRDPRHWQDAECFRPERFYESSIDYKGTSFQNIPFGAGRRICAGIFFGIAVVELQLAHLLYHFNWELPDTIMPSELDMTETFGVTVKRKHPLHLHATAIAISA
ncbi:hypothetical protein RJ639_008255 [Escallonia herrerae]|uniref:Cytochrome P450 n=1 Tax=Escallonia herrerae TaxID=1293975 RepID=A0AA89ART1_9ASTE|nr:hypothetical protein RJ639_008255 [Escallonia herrerae]